MNRTPDDEDPAVAALGTGEGSTGTGDSGTMTVSTFFSESDQTTLFQQTFLNPQVPRQPETDLINMQRLPVGQGRMESRLI